MKDIAPYILRQRLLIEAYYEADIDRFGYCCLCMDGKEIYVDGIVHMQKV